MNRSGACTVISSDDHNDEQAIQPRYPQQEEQRILHEPWVKYGVNWITRSPILG